MFKCKSEYNNYSTDFAEKLNFSWKKSNFSEKSGFSSEKISDGLFLVINSDFQICLPLTDQKLKKLQLVPYFLTKNHLLSSKKHCPICIFWGNLTKRTQKNPRFF